MAEEWAWAKKAIEDALHAKLHIKVISGPRDYEYAEAFERPEPQVWVDDYYFEVADPMWWHGHEPVTPNIRRVAYKAVRFTEQRHNKDLLVFV